MTTVFLTDTPDRAGPRPSVPAEIIPPFDYAQIAPELAGELQKTAATLRDRTNECVIKTGQDLLRIKALLEHGAFVRWVEDECGLKIRTAQRAMLAATQIAENDKLSYLPVDALVALASRRAPQAIVKDFIEQIEAGARPSAAEIMREITAAKPPQAGNVPAGASPPPVLNSDKAAQEPAGSSVEQELAALNDAWDRASPEARDLFLAQKIAAQAGTEPPGTFPDTTARLETVQPPAPRELTEPSLPPPEPHCPLAKPPQPTGVPINDVVNTPVDPPSGPTEAVAAAHVMAQSSTPADALEGML